MKWKVWVRHIRKSGWASQGSPPLFSKILGNAVPYATGNFQTRDVCHAMKNSDINFRNRQLWRMKHDFRKFQEKRTTFPGAANFPKFFYIWLNVSLFRNSTISVFSENLSWKFSHHLSPLQNFRNFRLKGKCPRIFDQNRKLPTSFCKQSNCLFHGCRAWKASKN